MEKLVVFILLMLLVIASLYLVHIANVSNKQLLLCAFAFALFRPVADFIVETIIEFLGGK